MPTCWGKKTSLGFASAWDALNCSDCHLLPPFMNLWMSWRQVYGCNLRLLDELWIIDGWRRRPDVRIKVKQLAPSTAEREDVTPKYNECRFWNWPPKKVPLKTNCRYFLNDITLLIADFLSSRFIIKFTFFQQLFWRELQVGAENACKPIGEQSPPKFNDLTLLAPSLAVTQLSWRNACVTAALFFPELIPAKHFRPQL